MPTKLPSIIAAIVTILLMLVIVVIFGFGGIVLLNGFMDASAAVYTGFVCLGLTLIICPILAWVLVKALISRFNWNNILAVIMSVLVSAFIGGGLGFFSMIVMGIVAEAM